MAYLLKAWAPTKHANPSHLFLHTSFLTTIINIHSLHSVLQCLIINALSWTTMPMDFQPARLLFYSKIQLPPKSCSLLPTHSKKIKEDKESLLTITYSEASTNGEYNSHLVVGKNEFSRASEIPCLNHCLLTKLLSLCTTSFLLNNAPFMRIIICPPLTSGFTLCFNGPWSGWLHRCCISRHSGLYAVATDNCLIDNHIRLCSACRTEIQQLPDSPSCRPIVVTSGQVASNLRWPSGRVTRGHSMRVMFTALLRTYKLEDGIPK